MSVKYDEILPYFKKRFQFSPKNNMTNYTAQIVEIGHTPLDQKLYVDLWIAELQTTIKLMPDSNFLKQLKRGGHRMRDSL